MIFWKFQVGFTSQITQSFELLRSFFSVIFWSGKQENIFRRRQIKHSLATESSSCFLYEVFYRWSVVEEKIVKQTWSYFRVFLNKIIENILLKSLKFKLDWLLLLKFVWIVISFLT